MNKYKKAYEELVEFSYIDGSCYNVDMDETYPLLEDKYENQRKLIRELVERATPKKPKFYKKIRYHNLYSCPNCGVNNVELKFCTDCGQALDWSDE